MLPRWIQRIAFAAAIAVMPLQGIASVLNVLMCHGDAQVHATHAGDSHYHSEPAPADYHHHGPTAGDDGAMADGSFHLCCNLAASVPVGHSIGARLPDFLVRAMIPAPLHDLFVPDQPQRPPLA